MSHIHLLLVKETLSLAVMQISSTNLYFNLQQKALSTVIIKYSHFYETEAMKQVAATIALPMGYF